MTAADGGDLGGWAPADGGDLGGWAPADGAFFFLSGGCLRAV